MTEVAKVIEQREVQLTDRKAGLFARLRKGDQTKVARALVDEEHWDKLLLLDDRSGITETEPTTLPLVLLAALEKEDEQRVAKIVALAGRPHIEPGIGFAVTSRLLAWARPEQAWEVLRTIRCAEPSNRLTALYHRVAIKATNVAVVAAAQSGYKKLLGPGDAAPPSSARADATRPAPYEFPNTPCDALPVPGRLTILERDGLPSRHRQAYEALLKNFDPVVAARPKPKVVQFEDVFVNRLGQIWKPDGTLLVGTRAPPPNESWQRVPVIDSGALATNATKGFFHWYAELFPSLAWRVGTGVPKFPVLLGTHAASFCDETLRLAGCPREEIKRIEIVRCKTLFVAQTRLMCLADWPRFSNLYDAAAKSASVEAAGLPLPPCIYISRRDTTRRVMRNESALEAALAAIGIRPVIMSEMSMAQQIHLVRHVRLVVAPHGAGLSHIIAGNRGLKVLEIMPVQSGSHSLRFNFARLSRMCGHDHTLWLEPINATTGSWAVDIQAIIALARDMLRSL